MAVSLAQACHPATFAPSVFGSEVLSLSAHLVSNYSVSVPEAFRYVDPAAELQNASFCNITVTYTHPGQDDNVIVETWLPIENWNGRLQAIGGGGWIAGRFFLTYNGMYGALADGFATTTTDAGLGNAMEASSWSLLSPGNVNLYNLQNFASVSLNDEAIISKSLIRSFYGRDPEYSYWNGCSQGGRQGLMLAQRYPTVYDGIAAGAPAIYWNELFTQIQWPQQVMNELNHYPHGCEIDAITNAAVAACDELDGVADGIIARIDECLETFDPSSEIGSTAQCTQGNRTIDVEISKEAAVIVNATWHGITNTRGDQVYHGVAPGADLTGNSPRSFGQPGIVATNCSTQGQCTGAPSLLGQQWLQLFVAKNPEISLLNLTRAEFDELRRQGSQQYHSIIDTADADLTGFRDAGGKMITFHGLADNVIPSGGTRQYYGAVAQLLPDVRSFYRYFEAPGLGHCFGGASGQPSHLFRQLQDWVENGTAPEDTPIDVNVVGGEIHNRILCPYPEEAHFSSACGDAAAAECWSCTTNTDRRK